MAEMTDPRNIVWYTALSHCQDPAERHLYHQRSAIKEPRSPHYEPHPGYSDQHGCLRVHELYAH